MGYKKGITSTLCWILVGWSNRG